MAAVARRSRKNVTEALARTVLAQSAAAQPPAFDLGIGDEDEYDIDRVLGELGTSATGGIIKIQRIDPKNPTGPRAYVTECAPQEFSMKWLQENYGGGIYGVMVYELQKNGSGRYQLAPNGNKRVVIEGEAKRPDPKASAAAVPATGGVRDVDVMIMGFTKLAETMQAGFNSLQQQQRPSANSSVKETLEMLLLMKQAMVNAPAAPAVDPVSTMKSVFGMAKEMAETWAERGDGDGDDDSGMGVLARMGSTFLSEWQRTQAAAAAAQNQHLIEQQQPGDVAADPAAAAAAPAQALEDPMTMLERLAVAEIVERAARNEPVEEAADFIFDNTTPAQLAKLRAPEWWERIKSLNDRAHLYQLWFYRLHDYIIKTLDEPDTPATQ